MNDCGNINTVKVIIMVFLYILMMFGIVLVAAVVV
jgi:hypothetical protein